MKKSDTQFLNLKFHPTIQFVKSKAAFKIKYKDCFGMHSFYFDFLPIETSNPTINELLNVSYLTNSFLNRVPKLHNHPVNIPLKEF